MVRVVPYWRTASVDFIPVPSVLSAPPVHLISWAWKGMNYDEDSKHGPIIHIH